MAAFSVVVFSRRLAARASRSANCCLLSLKATDGLFMPNSMIWIGGQVKVNSRVTPYRGTAADRVEYPDAAWFGATEQWSDGTSPGKAMTAVPPALMPDCRRDRPRAKSIAARWFGLQIGTARPWLLSPCILMLSSRSRQSAGIMPPTRLQERSNAWVL